MPPEAVTETQETPEATDAQPQNLEGDPGKVVDVFKEAAATLEYTDDTPEEAKPEEDLEAKPDLEVPPSTSKPKKKEKKKKDVTVTEPKEETPVEAAPEPTEEPKLSKREAFKKKADEESAYRAKEAKLKEREAAAQAAEQRFKEFEADPVRYLEAKDPRFYEKLTERYLAEGKTSEKAETAALRAELQALKEEITGKVEDTTKQAQLAYYEQQLNEGERILSAEEFAPVRESAALFEKFTGQPTDYRKALADVWIEYKQMYNKELTPGECCEILLEDAQAHIDRVGAEFGQKQKPAESKKPPKKTPPPTGKTLTQKQETASDPAPAPEPKPQTFASKEEMFAAVAEGLEYEEPEE
jgi:hypothetical protein